MLMKEKIDINLPHEEFDSLEMIIMAKKKNFLNDISKKALKKKMIKEMLNDDNSIKVFYLMPINIIFGILAVLSKEQGYDQNISVILFIIACFFGLSYMLPFVRGCMLPFLKQKTKNKMKHDIFMDSIADNNILKVFIDTYGNEKIIEALVEKEHLTYADLQSLRNKEEKNVNNKGKANRIREALTCL